jgi:predicted cupin superfamily sugar epimerase
MQSAEYWISKLGMQKHPEGGYFVETYRSDEIIPKNCLNERYPSDRNISTTIYFLLTKDSPSKFHRIKSDEFWFYHQGGTLEIKIIDKEGNLESKKLGVNFDSYERLQHYIPQNNWFGAEVIEGDYVLISCTVAPGFDFSDFEIGNRNSLIGEYPNHTEIINRLT